MGAIDQRERAYRAAVYEVDGIGPARFQVLLSYFGNAKSIWEASENQIRELGMAKNVVREFVKQKKKVEPLIHLKALAQKGIRVVVWEDEEYPEILREVEQAPRVLFVRGHFKPEDSMALAVVGTRKPTPYGRDVTEKFVDGLVASGFTIVSGLARGIDGIAHRTALNAGGRTIGVLGGGADRVYPPEHVGLAHEICKHGAVISEFASGKLPVPGNFPARNRVISGLAVGVLVVEGASKSGTKITAKLAAEQGREVFAVPGPITSRYSQGPADLIKLGAKVVTGVQDILDELSIVDGGKQLKITKAVDLSKLFSRERKIFEVLADGNVHIDEITRIAGMDSAKVSAALTMLEIKGLVKHLGGMVYSRR